MAVLPAHPTVLTRVLWRTHGREWQEGRLFFVETQVYHIFLKWKKGVQMLDLHFSDFIFAFWFPYQE